MTLPHMVIKWRVKHEKQSMPRRSRFPPWSIEDVGGYFVVKDNNGQPLLFIAYREAVGRRSLARLLTRNAPPTDRGKYSKATGTIEKALT